MTVDEIRNLLSQGKKLSDDAVLRGLENLAGEHLGRLSEEMVADQMPRLLARLRLIRREARSGPAGVAAAKTDLRLLRAQTAYAAAPRDGGAGITRELKDLLDVAFNPLLSGDKLDGLDDLVVFLESLYGYAYFHHHVGRARRRSELRRRRKEEAAGGEGKPARPEREHRGEGKGEGRPGEPRGEGKPGEPRRKRRRDRGPRSGGPEAPGREGVPAGEAAPEPFGAGAQPTAAPAEDGGGPAAEPPAAVPPEAGPVHP
jgi:hypothetical protein